MGQHFIRLLFTSWTNVLNSLSTSTLSLVLFSLASPVLVFVITLAVVAKNNPGRRFVDHVKESILPAVIGLAVPMVLVAILFGWKVVATTFYDHQNMAGRWGNVVNEKNTLKQMLQDRDTYIKKLEAAKPSVVQNIKFLPQPKKCWIDTVGNFTSPQTGHAVALVTLHCNYRVDAPLHISLETNRPIANFNFTTPSIMTMMGVVSGTQKGLGVDRSLYIDLQSPSFAAEQMVVIQVESMTKDAPIPLKGSIDPK